MFNLSTLSGINLQTDNYFQYTSGRNLTLEKTPLRFNENASAFQTKRPCVWIETQGRFTENSFTFYFKRKGVFFGVYPPYFSMVLTTS